MRREFTNADLLSGPHDDDEKQLARLRSENELLRQQRDLLRNATAFFAKENKSMRFQLIDAEKADLSINRIMCALLNVSVSVSGYYGWKQLAPAGGNWTTWCSLPMSGRILRSRMGPSFFAPVNRRTANYGEPTVQKRGRSS